MSVRWLVLAAAACIVGCATVTSPVPLGKNPAALEAEELDGVWANADGVAHLLVTDPAGGLQIVTVDEEDGRLASESLDIVVRTHGNYTIANIAQPADEDAAASAELRYLFALLKISDGQIIVWSPNAERIAAMVEGNELPGEVDDSDVHLADLDALQLERLLTDPLAFAWDEPGVLIRLRQ